MMSLSRMRAAAAAVLLIAGAPAGASSPPSPERPIGEIAQRLDVGDVVFIRVPAYPFRKVASATQTWTNHVGIVIDVSGKEPLIGESKFPFSRATPLSRFVARSEDGRFAVSRLNADLTPAQRAAIPVAAKKHFGVFYDTGFDLHSHREFCSRFVREVLDEATGTQVGDVETFADMLHRNPNAELTFWKWWYFGRIPWSRQTVTPASILRSDKLHIVVDGNLRDGLFSPRAPS